MEDRPVSELLDTERGLDDAGGLDSRPEDILFVWYIVVSQQSIHVLEIATTTEKEGVLFKYPNTVTLSSSNDIGIHVVYVRHETVVNKDTG